MIRILKPIGFSIAFIASLGSLSILESGGYENVVDPLTKERLQSRLTVDDRQDNDFVSSDQLEAAEILLGRDPRDGLSRTIIAFFYLQSGEYSKQFDVLKPLFRTRVRTAAAYIEAIAPQLRYPQVYAALSPHLQNQDDVFGVTALSVLARKAPELIRGEHEALGQNPYALRVVTGHYLTLRDPDTAWSVFCHSQRDISCKQGLVDAELRLLGQLFPFGWVQSNSKVSSGPRGGADILINNTEDQIFLRQLLAIPDKGLIFISVSDKPNAITAFVDISCFEQSQKIIGLNLSEGDNVAVFRNSAGCEFGQLAIRGRNSGSRFQNNVMHLSRAEIVPVVDPQ